jgi:hypothetical protein
MNDFNYTIDAEYVLLFSRSGFLLLPDDGTPMPAVTFDIQCPGIDLACER